MTPTSRRRWLILIAMVVGLLFLTKSAFWISSGCPLGFALGSCATEITGKRLIMASSDHLLDQVGLKADGVTAVIDLGSRQVVVRGDLATVDKATEFVIPVASKQVEFSVRGDRLRVLADGRDVEPAARTSEPVALPDRP
jgi:hypothetical protein